jgi:hypothetical protein
MLSTSCVTLAKLAKLATRERTHASGLGIALSACLLFRAPSSRGGSVSAH